MSPTATPEQAATLHNAKRSAALFSVAGILATMGFVGKLYVLDAGAAAAA